MGTENLLEYSKYAITAIRTDKFIIGFMGRTGSRTIMSDILGGTCSHAALFESFSDFNNRDYQKDLGSIPHILVLRDPVERAASGQRLGLHPEYHGHPFLSNIDFDTITHIIRFEDLPLYFDSHEGFISDSDKSKLDQNDESVKELRNKELVRVFSGIHEETDRVKYKFLSALLKTDFGVLHFGELPDMPELKPENEENPGKLSVDEFQLLASNWVQMQRVKGEKNITISDWIGVTDYGDISFDEENELYQKFLREKPLMDPAVFSDMMEEIKP
jgi:hypothetical protein